MFVWLNMHKNVVSSLKFALCTCYLRMLKLTYAAWFRTQVKAESPFRECRKSDVSDKHWLFKMSLKIPESIEVYCLEVCLSPVILKGNFYLYMQHTEAIQISLHISRKRLGLCEETIAYWENISRFFGRPSFTSTRVWCKVKLFAYWLFGKQGGSSTLMKTTTYWICTHSCLCGMNQKMKKNSN